MVDSQTPFPHRRNEEGLYDSICPTLPASFIRCSKNLASIDFNILLTEVMTIADEIDSQLSRAMASYVSQTTGGALVPRQNSIRPRNRQVLTVRSRPDPPTPARVESYETKGRRYFGEAQAKKSEVLTVRIRVSPLTLPPLRTGAGGRGTSSCLDLC